MKSRTVSIRSRQFPLLAVLFLSWNTVRCEERVIELTDGSVVVGEVMAAGNGAYTVKTGRFGTITLKDSDIVAIRSKDAVVRSDVASQPAPASPGTETLQSVRQRIMSDPNLLNSVNTLKDDPDLQNVLKDPELMKAIQEGNLNALKDNPKIRDLMGNAALQNIYKNLSR